MKLPKFFIILLILIITSLIICCSENSTNSPAEELNNISNPEGGYINKLTTNSEGDFFAGTPYGLFISTDRGSSWNSLTSMINTILDVKDILITSDNQIFIISDSFIILRSTDKGVTWTDATTSSRTNYSIKEDLSGNLFACGGDLFKSTDDGSSWEIFRIGAVYNICFPNDTLIIIGVQGIIGGEVSYSSDNGSTWFLTGSNINVSEFYVHNSLVFAGGLIGFEGGGGVYKSTDYGIDWESCGFDYISVLSFTTNNQDNLFIGTSAGIYYTENEGTTWQKVLPDSFVTTLMNDSKGFLYAGTNKGTFMRSTDNGMTWHN